MERVLVAYATRHGSTREVADELAATLHRQGIAVDVKPAADVDGLDGYAGVVLGCALYTGRVHRDARGFLKTHRRVLAGLPLAVFAMGPRTTEADDMARSRAQLDRALAAVPDVEPVSVAIFGGVVDPGRLHFPFSRMPASDARDRDAIQAWAEEVAGLLAVPV
jgi:menaquinone-dependent protoporphyrinogen oxidase